MNRHHARRARKNARRNTTKAALPEARKGEASSGCLLCKAWERRMILGVYVPFDSGKPTASYWLCPSCTMSPGCKARVEGVLKERFGCDC